jgi:hypothetical protein
MCRRLEGISYPEAYEPGADTEGIKPGTDLSSEAEEFYLAVGIIIGC